MRFLHAGELRFALRRLLKRPGATAAAVAALACGIGSAAATWALFSALLLNPLPVRAPERLFVTEQQYETRPGEFRTFNAHVYPTYTAIRDAGVFEAVAAGGVWEMLVTEQGALPQAR